MISYVSSQLSLFSGGVLKTDRMFQGLVQFLVTNCSDDLLNLEFPNHRPTTVYCVDARYGVCCRLYTAVQLLLMKLLLVELWAETEEDEHKHEKPDHQ